MKKILSFTMAAVCIFLMLAMCGSTYASDTPTIRLSSASATQGDEVEITISIDDNTKGFFMLEMNISFDNASLEFVKCESKLPDGLNQLPDKQANDKGKLPIIYYNTIVGEGNNMIIENVEGDIDLFVLKFKIKDKATAGEYGLTLNVTAAKYIDGQNMPDLDVIAESGSIKVTSTVSGHAYGFLNAEDPITVALYSGNDLIGEVDADKNASYAFKDVKPGEYLLRISKAHHVTRELTITVGENDVVVQDVTLDIVGDVNKDREVNNEDLDILSRYLAKWANYSVDLTVADVNADGKVNNLDRAILSRYLDGWEGYTSLPYNP